MVDMKKITLLFAVVLIALCASVHAQTWRDIQITPDVFGGNFSIAFTVNANDVTDLSYTVKEGDTLTMSVGIVGHVEGSGGQLTIKLPEGFVAARTVHGLMRLQRVAHDQTRGKFADVLVFVVKGQPFLYVAGDVGGPVDVVILGQMTMQVTR